ncbi:hypothetical protein QUF73_04420 [Cytobacillus sp. NJ13]|nr:hypothetical protein [Cytobacillus sp. NJ13]
MERFPALNLQEDYIGIAEREKDRKKNCFESNILYNFIKFFVPKLKNKKTLEIGYTKADQNELSIHGMKKYSGLNYSEVAEEICCEGLKGLLINYEWCEPENLSEGKTYDVIALNQMIEYIPVFEMEKIWGVIKNLLCQGGYIVLKTILFNNPNTLEECESPDQILDERCHKQTIDTILRTCLQQGFILASYKNNCFGMVLKSDLHLFEKEKQEMYLSCHTKILSEHGLEMKENYEDEEIEKVVLGAGRLLIGCVTENIEKYRDQTLRLVQSVRWFGGHMAGANIFVCIVDRADPEFVDKLKKLGVFVRIVKRFSEDHPQSNKLRLFELDEIGFYDTVMLMDCDTIVVQDPYPFIDGVNFQAEFAAGPTVPHYVFKSLFSHFGLKLLPLHYRTAVTNTPTMLYCNAGVLIFPKKILQVFYPIWKQYTHNLIEKKYLLGRYFNFCEQASLTLAYAAHPIPFSKLPMEMNFHLLESNLSKVKNCDPIIIHYHNNVDEKGLIIDKTSSSFARNRVQYFNRRLIEYCNKEERS